MKRQFKIIAKISGNTFEYDNIDENGVGTFTYSGNKASSKKSIMQAFKRDLNFLSCKLEKVIEFKEV